MSLMPRLKSSVASDQPIAYIPVSSQRCRCLTEAWIAAARRNWLRLRFFVFFFQAEDGIRDHCVTGVQTCALPIYSLRYDSPVWSGFNFSSQVSLRDSSGFADNVGPSANPANPIVGGDNGDHASELRHAYVFGIAGYYNNGPIQAGVGYERNVKVRNYNVVPSPNQFYANDWALTITGAYNFGVVRPAIVYERLDYDTPTGSLTRDFYGLSVTAPIGPGALYFFWGDALDGKGGAVNGERVGGLTKGTDTGSQQLEISYTYPLSKRTQVYAGYVKLQNEKNAAYTFNINAYTINTSCTVSQPSCGTNGKPQGIVLGMIHLF